MSLVTFLMEKAKYLVDKYTIGFCRNRIVIGGRKFSFCTIPVPEGYKQSQTHPSILYFPNQWHGYSHLLATTPYHKRNIRFENPCIYYASEAGSPTIFSPHPTNPIIPLPSGKTAYNSDPCLFFENNRLYLINRKCERAPDLREIEVCYSDDGIHFSQPETIITETTDKKELLSPSIIPYANKKRMYFLNTDAGTGRNKKCTGIDIYEGTSFEQADFSLLKTGQFLNHTEIGIEPWHFDLFQYDNKLYMVLCAVNIRRRGLLNRMNTYLAVSDDYQFFRIFPTPIVQLIRTYRPTAYLDGNNTLHLYFSVVGEVADDKSDRAIALTSFDFPDLLKKL